MCHSRPRLHEDKLRRESISQSTNKMERDYFTYILSNKPYGTLYIGVTNDLLGRVYQHKKKLVKGFTKKYSVNRLVYYESCGDINAAIQREKRLKKWNRQWKIRLIEDFNPEWKDLYPELLSGKGLMDPRLRGDDKGKESDKKIEK